VHSHPHRRNARRLPCPAIAALALGAACAIAACGGGGSSGSGNTTPAQPPPTTSFSGTVRFQGAPLAGATVVAFDTNTNRTFATATTDASGHYSFTGLNTSCSDSCVQDYQFWPAKAGYAFYPVLAGAAPGSRSAYQWDSAPSNWYVPNGAAITRAGYNGQFTNASGGAGIVFTTFNFHSVPTDSVSGADFDAYDGANPLVHLAASGQSISYSPGDDAARHAGVAWPAARFVDNHDGTVVDGLTGLVWLKDAGCLAPNAWAAAIGAVNQLASGACGLSDGTTAGQWRMPNLWELESIVDESAAGPAVTAGSPFVHVAATGYWTSTSYYGGIGGSPEAWAIRMSDGRYLNDGSTNLKATGSLAVWAVRGAGGGAVALQATGLYTPYVPGDDGTVQAGVPLTFPRMRDNGDGTVTDTVTGLVWLRQADCIHDTWAGALAAVNGLASGQCGLTDGSAPASWRMPNRKEMQSLVDRAQNNQADFFGTAWTSGNPTIASMGAVFANFIQLQYYWTSTTDASDTSSAWTVFSCDFGVYDVPKTATGYALAVR